MIKKNTLDIQNLIKVKFNNQKLLKQSLTHKSFNSDDNNEKLEFLGDRVLGLILSQMLLDSYPKEKEGIIDKKFANLVNKKTCAIIAKRINLKEYMILGDSYKGFQKGDEKITSDALEALIGAIYLDKGLETAKKFILNNWKNELNKTHLDEVDSKTKLQEFSLKNYKKLPIYRIFKKKGPEHSPLFKVEVKIHKSKSYLATGKSRKEAEQKAAKKLLNDFKI